MRVFKVTFFYSIVLTAFLFLFSGSGVEAATLSFSPGTGSFSVGDTISATLQLDSEGASVNASEAAISFDSSKLTVQSISRDGSAFSLWAVEPEFSNAAGTINFSGGTPSPFTGTRTILTVLFTANAEGDASVAIDSGNVLAADGLGTDVLSGSTGASYSIEASAPPPPPDPTPPTPAPTQPTGRTPAAPKVSSPSHSEEDIWYNETTAKIEWDLPFGITGVRFLIDENEESEPTETFIPPVAEQEIADIGDGVWYTHVQFQNKNGWGTVAHYKLQIDSTPPAEFDLSAIGGDLELTLEISESTDELSGISGYEILLDGEGAISLDLEDIEDGTYVLAGVDPGEHELTVRILDLAGNVTEASTDVTVEGTLTTATVGLEEEGPGIFGPVYWVTIIFVILLAVVTGMLLFEKKKTREEKEHIKVEANEAREKLELIFSVLRDEIEEQVVAIARKPNMTDTEREVLEQLKEALELSEELLDKEIEDIRKLLK